MPCAIAMLTPESQNILQKKRKPGPRFRFVCEVHGKVNVAIGDSPAIREPRPVAPPVPSSPLHKPFHMNTFQLSLVTFSLIPVLQPTRTYIPKKLHVDHPYFLLPWLIDGVPTPRGGTG